VEAADWLVSQPDQVAAFDRQGMLETQQRRQDWVLSPLRDGVMCATSQCSTCGFLSHAAPLFKKEGDASGICQ
jgi:hypothetical protein